MFVAAVANNNTRINVSIHDVDVNTLANAILMAMRMNDGNQIQQRGSTAKDIANAVLMTLGTTTQTTNKLTTTPIPFRASSTMELTDDSIISPPPPLSPIHRQSPMLHYTQHTNNYVPPVPHRRSQNQLPSLALPSKPNNNTRTTSDATVSNSTPLLQWSLTSKGKDLLIINNHTFKWNKSSSTKQYWRCDEAEYCDVWVHTTLDGIYISMTKSDHDHFCDPDRIVISKVIGLMRARCKQELISIATIYEQEVKKAKLTDTQLCRMPRYDQLRKWFLFLSAF